jgi:hypothetical protein
MKTKNGQPLAITIDDTQSDISNCSAAEFRRKCDTFFRGRNMKCEFNYRFGRKVETTHLKKQ